MINKLIDFLLKSPLSEDQKSDLLLIIKQICDDENPKLIQSSLDDLIQELSAPPPLESNLPEDISGKEQSTSVSIRMGTLSYNEQDEPDPWMRTIIPRESLAPAEHPPAPQEKDLGTYTDLGLLGQGGMGEVRLVKDKKLNRTVAMKIMHTRFSQNQDALIRFIEESQVGAQLQHPNIAPVYERGVLPGGQYYFTMREIKGIEFNELIDEVHAASTPSQWNKGQKGTTFRQLIHIFHQVCETVAYSHSLGVLHRDLKPNNVMVGEFGEVLVVDWGMAKVVGQENYRGQGDKELIKGLAEENELATDRSDQKLLETQTGAIAGTPMYMSPEQAHGQSDQIHFTSDIYSLGVILYEIISGSPPFTGRSVHEILDQVRSKRPPSLLTSQDESLQEQETDDQLLSEIDPCRKYPLPLVNICEKAMQYKIEDRYSSVSQLAQALLEWLDGAQKRDKALEEFFQAKDVIKQAQETEQRSLTLWNQANFRLEKSGTTDALAWTLWTNAEDARREARELKRYHHRLLTGALVYDSELEEAHYSLASLLIEEILNAVAQGEQQKRVDLDLQFKEHLHFLPLSKREKLKVKLDQKLSEEVNVLRSRRGNLVGRSTQINDITNQLKLGTQLISLVGTAGVGKTRLALEIIYKEQASHLKAYFCDLTEASESIDIVRVVAQSMGLRLRHINPIGQLGEYFAKQETLLVLDNLEQVTQPAGVIIQQWIEDAPTLQVIATSRVRLDIAEETVFSINPLSNLEAIELFVHRGRTVAGDFQLSERNREVISRIVSQLDRLPLAIELAAARLNIFNEEEIESRLHQRFSLLRSRKTENQTLYAALDWSWELLKPWEKRALSQASVFNDGFDLQAAESILQVEYWRDSPPIFDLLHDLIEASLLYQDKTIDGQIRYKMLESIKHYAANQLSTLNRLEVHGSEADLKRETEQRHASYFSRFGEQEFQNSLEGIDGVHQWNRLFLELNNLISATVRGEVDHAFRCCLGALKVLEMEGPTSMGVDVISTLIKRGGLDPIMVQKLNLEHAKYLRVCGKVDEAKHCLTPHNADSNTLNLKFEESDYNQDADDPLRAAELLERGHLKEAESFYDEAHTYYSQAIVIYESIKDSSGVVNGLIGIAHINAIQGEYQIAKEKLTLALSLTFEHGLYRIRAHILSRLGTVYKNTGEYEQSITSHTQALHINRDFGNKRGTGSTLGNLGNAYQHLGQHREAIRHYTQAIEINRETGELRTLATNLGNLAVVYQNINQNERAIEYYTQAIKICKDIGAHQSLGIHLGNLGDLYQKLKQTDQAIQALKEAIALCDKIGFLASGAFRGSLALIYAQQKNFTESLQLIRDGESIIRPIPLEYGKFLCKKAQVLSLNRCGSQAQEALQHAESIAIKLKVRAGSELSELINELQELHDN